MPADTQEGTWLETDSVSQGRWKGQRPPSSTRWVVALAGATEGQLVELWLGHLALLLSGRKSGLCQDRRSCAVASNGPKAEIE